MNTAIYARKMPLVSQDIRTQITACKKIAIQKNLIVPQHYIYTDANPIADGLRSCSSLLKHCEAGAIDTIVVEDFTILTGSIFYIHQLLSEIGESGVRIISVNENIDWSPSESKELASQWLQFISATVEAHRFFLRPTVTDERSLFRSCNKNKVPRKSMVLWKKIDRLQEALSLGSIGVHPIFS